MRHAREIAPALLIVLAACEVGGGPDTVSLHPPTLRVTLDAPESIEVGEATETVTAHVTWADGTPASGYTFSVYADCLEHRLCTIIVPTSASTGTETIYLHGRDFSGGILMGKAALADSSTVHSESHRVVFIPDGGDWFQAAVTDAVLAPGERRPFAGLAHSTGGPGGRWQSAAKPQYAVDDTAVATVDGDGVVTAVAAGSTTLRLTLGAMVATVALVVDATLPLGPPPEGVSSLHSVREIENLFAISSASRRPDHGLVVDSRGYPQAITRFGTRALLVGWTGTGFGTELLPDGFDITESATIAVDSLDRLYVLTHGDLGAHVYDRDATAGPSAWRRRTLDSHVAELDRLGGEWTDYLRTTQDGSMSLLPRHGGGLHVAYRVNVDARSAAYAFPCGSIYRYAEVTDDAVATADITADWVDLAAPGPCPFDDIVSQRFVLARGADGAPQFILPYGNRLSRSVETSNVGFATYTRGVDGRWRAPPGVPNGTGGHFGPRPSEGFSVNVLNPPPLDDGREQPSVLFPGLATNDIDAPYVVAGNGRTYLGSYVGSLGLVEAGGGAPGDRYEVFGIATRASMLHVLARGPDPIDAGFQVLTRRLPPPDPQADTPERGGRLAKGTSAAGPVFAPDVVLPDGTRLALQVPPGATDGVRHLYRSEGADLPWTQVGSATTLGPVTPLEAEGTDVYAFDDAGALVRSSDRATTFAPVTAPLPEGIGDLVHLAVVAGRGVVLDLGSHLAFATFAGTPGTSTFRTIAMLATDPQGWSLGSEAEKRRLVADDDGFTFVAEARGGTIAPRIFVRRFGWDGTVRSEATYGTVLGRSYEELQVGTGAVVADGSLVFAGFPGRSGAPVRTHRVSLATGAWSAGDVGILADNPKSLVALADGTFLLGGVVDPRSLAPAHEGGVYHQRRVVLWRSSDGLHWGAPVIQRPDGGDGQTLKILFDDGHGGATLVLEDNFQMSPDGPGLALVQTAVLP